MIALDVARFASDDPEPIVSASFACPYCLKAPAHVVLDTDGTEGAAALCRCDNCDADWEVALGFGQSLRMALAPPTGIALVTVQH